MKQLIFFLLLLCSISGMAQKKAKQDLYLLFDMKDTVHYKPDFAYLVNGDIIYDYHIEYHNEGHNFPIQFRTKHYPSQNKYAKDVFISRDSATALPVKDIQWLETYYIQNDSIYSPDVACAILNVHFGDIFLVVDDPKKEKIRITKPDLCQSAHE